MPTENRPYEFTADWPAPVVEQSASETTKRQDVFDDLTIEEMQELRGMYEDQIREYYTLKARRVAGWPLRRAGVGIEQPGRPSTGVQAAEAFFADAEEVALAASDDLVGEDRQRQIFAILIDQYEKHITAFRNATDRHANRLAVRGWDWLRFNRKPIDSPGRADPENILWVSPAAIRYKLFSLRAREMVPGGVRSGDWDLHTRPYTLAIKYRGLRERFAEGKPWERTILFRHYERRLETKGQVLKCGTMQELVERYEDRIDSLYESIRENGILLPSEENKKIDFMHVYIGRSGEIIFGFNGNHRLTIAKILGLEHIPVKVLTRHGHWQALRNRLVRSGTAGVPDEILQHPDLHDILAESAAPSAD